MRDVVIFTRQFSTMINAGLPLVQPSTSLKQTENKVLSRMCARGRFDVESGTPSPTPCQHQTRSASCM
jgi:type IV pilus assembly protein PilC